MRSVGVRRQVKAIALNGSSNNGNTGAPELVMVGVPRLNLASLSPNAVVGFEGLEPIELALVLL